MATTTNYYGLSKPSYNEVADIEVINANMDKIDTQMKNNSDGVNFAKKITSDFYDNTKTYKVGDYCVYDNKLYKCTTAITSEEAFNVDKWKETTVAKELNSIGTGGGGGGGGSATTINQIFSASSSADTNTLLESLENYDMLVCMGYVGDGNISCCLPVDFIKNNYTSEFDYTKCLQMANDSRAINFYFVDATNFKYYQQGSYYIKNIYGIKL